MLTVIVARARNGAIGFADGLPWRIPEDLAFFKRTTMGATLIMGRRTWESIGRPLPGRRMVVVSRRAPAAGDASAGHAGSAASSGSAESSGPAASAVTWSTSLDDALARHRDDGPELFVIGGADVYRQAIPRADRLLVTEVEADPPGDTFLAAPDPRDWVVVSREERVAADGTPFAWVDLRRRAAAVEPAD